MVYLDATLGEKLFEVPVGQPVPQVPAHRQKDHLGRETETSEPRGHPHRRSRTASALHQATLTGPSALRQRNRAGHAAQPLPWSRRRIHREAACGGHQLWAAAGTLFEQVITAEGETEHRELTRHQTKRDTTRHKDGTVRHQFYSRYTMNCPAHPDHDWWEPLLKTAEDAKAKFNRTEYLRIAPTTGKDHRRLYGMRQDTESLNAQLERAFYGQRLPAWGVHNQTTIVLLAALAENSWARHVWYDEARDQAQHPPGVP